MTIPLTIGHRKLCIDMALELGGSYLSLSEFESARQHYSFSHLG
ncbi:MAG: hypothetical protein ACFBSF_01855 [Leptolyngbyaceae cyanobacterium]